MAYGESMEVDFAIIKLPVGRFVANFFALEEVIDGILQNTKPLFFEIQTYTLQALKKTPFFQKCLRFAVIRAHVHFGVKGLLHVYHTYDTHAAVTPLMRPDNEVDSDQTEL